MANFSESGNEHLDPIKSGAFRDYQILKKGYVLNRPSLCFYPIYKIRIIYVYSSFPDSSSGFYVTINTSL